MTKKLEGFVNERELVLGWYNRVATVAVGHYKTAEKLTWRHRFFTYFSASSSAIVGTAVFATMGEQPETWMKVAAGLISVVAAVFSVLASSLGIADRAERHRDAAAKYNAVGREFEQELLKETVSLDWLNDIRRRLDSLAADMPHIPKSVHNEISKPEDLERWGDKKK